MHLDNKSLFILISPFILAGILWFFSDILLKSFSPDFESSEPTRASMLKTQEESYQFIIQHKEEYSSLLSKIRTREENRFFISERLYTPHTIGASTKSLDLSPPPMPPPPLLLFNEGNITAHSSSSWSVQMVMPDHQSAIINNKIYRVGESKNGVKLLDVTPSKIYIQTPKGKQWVKLFQ